MMSITWEPYVEVETIFLGFVGRDIVLSFGEDMELTAVFDGELLELGAQALG